MTKNNEPTHEEVLNRIHAAIDIPQEIHDEIERSYKSIGSWLARDRSAIRTYEPSIETQGSVRLGTANKPIRGDGQYDIDMVCTLKNQVKSNTTQKRLKDEVGRELSSYCQFHGMNHGPKNKRRCWTLKYSRESNFHVDVLPCLPDAIGFRRQLFAGNHQEFARDSKYVDLALAITDDTSPLYDSRTEDWPSSNPFGYSAWFFEQMAERLRIAKSAYLEKNSRYSTVEDVPNYKVKTTLQKAIQLLKRHRDKMFADDPEDQPISIIITTLAALAYDNEDNLCDALEAILEGMEEHIEKIRDNRHHETVFITNPVNPNENFADKWTENTTKKDCFYQWLTQARRDFGEYLMYCEPMELPSQLQEKLGHSLVEKVKKSLKSAGSTKSPVGTSKEDRIVAIASKINEGKGGTKPWCRATI